MGSNVTPLEHVPRGLARLAARVRVTGVSTFHRTPAVGPRPAPPFVNGVVAIRTDATPEVLIALLKDVEAREGRVRTADRYAPRTLDLDVLHIEGVHRPDLAIPDPDVAERAFLSVPLHELDPALVLPDGRRVADLARAARDTPLEPLPDLTRRLRDALLGAPPAEGPWRRVPVNAREPGSGTARGPDRAHRPRDP